MTLVSLTQHLLSAYNVLSMVLAAGDTAVNKTEKCSYPLGAYILLPKYVVLKSAIAANFPQECVSHSY